MNANSSALSPTLITKIGEGSNSSASRSKADNRGAPVSDISLSTLWPSLIAAHGIPSTSCKMNGDKRSGDRDSDV